MPIIVFCLNVRLCIIILNYLALEYLPNLEALFSFVDCFELTIKLPGAHFASLYPAALQTETRLS